MILKISSPAFLCNLAYRYDKEKQQTTWGKANHFPV